MKDNSTAKDMLKHVGYITDPTFFDALERPRKRIIKDWIIPLGIVALLWIGTAALVKFDPANKPDDFGRWKQELYEPSNRLERKVDYIVHAVDVLKEMRLECDYCHNEERWKR